MIIKNIFIFSLILCFESFIYVAVVWNIVKLSDSYIFLGLLLTFVTIALFLLKKFINFNKYEQKNIYKLNRICGAIFSIGLLFISEFDLVTLYFILSVFSIFSFLNMNMIETILLKEILKNKDIKLQLSIIFQTGSQFAGLLGAFFATLFLTYLDMHYIFVFTAFLLLLGVFLLEFFSFDNLKPISFNIKNNNISNKGFMLMFFLTFWLFSLNFLLPIISQNVNNWKAIEFGFVDIALGLGCLSVMIIIIYSNKLIKILKYAWIGFLLISLLMFFISNIYINIALFFAMGIIFNSVRVFERSVIYGNIKEEKVYEYANKITIYIFLGKSLPPLVLGLLLNYTNSSLLMLILSFLLSIVSFRYINKNYLQ